MLDHVQYLYFKAVVAFEFRYFRRSVVSSVLNHSVLDHIRCLNHSVSVSLSLIIAHSPFLDQSVLILEARGLLGTRDQYSITQWGCAQGAGVILLFRESCCAYSPFCLFSRCSARASLAGCRAALLLSLLDARRCSARWCFLCVFLLPCFLL